MTEEKIHEAIGQVLTDCGILEATDYHSVSMRGELYKLGFNSDEADEVLRYCADKGFNYCLDPMFPSKTRGTNEPTPEFACYWGPDQLASRLACVVPFATRSLYQDARG